MGTCSLSAQKAKKLSLEQYETMKNFEDTISMLSYGVVNDSVAERRFVSCRDLISKLKTVLQTPNSFKYPFKKTEQISILYPQDSSFRIFTWQLKVSPDEYRYYGAIQMNTKQLKMFPLIDRSANIENAMSLEKLPLKNDDWYGALYYNIKEMKTNGETYYLVFGYDAFSRYHRRKLVDVLYFEDGIPHFGKEVFQYVKEEHGPGIVYRRIIKEYSATASIAMNYDAELDAIVFDHLMTVSGQYGEGPVQVPDGTYSSYKFKKGMWHYEDKLFHQTMDEPPFQEKPKSKDAPKRDIFGREIKN